MLDVQRVYQEYLNTAAGVAAFHAFKEVMYGEDDELIIELYNVLRHQLDAIEHKPIDILDVGGGDGRRLRAITLAMVRDELKWQAVLLDPSATLIDICKQEWGENRAIDIFYARLENFYVRERFDLILLLHSIFTFNDCTYVQRLRHLLRQKGLVVIQSNAPNSFLAGLKRITDARFDSTTERREIAAVKDDLEKADFHLTEHELKFTVPDVVRHGQLTERGNTILEWIAMTPLTELSSEIVKQATAYFMEHCIDGAFVEEEQVLIAS